MNKLKPCPFCGKDVFLLDVATRSSANALWDVYCRTHGCFLNSGTNNMFSKREEAIIAWNTRIESPELTTLREQVKALEDSKKAMLAEILMISDRIKADFNGHNELACIAAEVFHSHLNIHLNRMEAKL